MANPVFAKSPAFQAQDYAPVEYQQGGYAGTTYAQPGYQQPPQGYAQPQAGYAPPGQQYPQQGQPYPQAQGWVPPQQVQPIARTGVMTLDDAITKSAIVMGVLFVAAAITYMLFTPMLYTAPMIPLVTMIVSSLVSFIVVLVATLRYRTKPIAPAAVLTYSVIEGVCIGSLSAVFEWLYPGIVFPAVLGTFVTAGAVLFAYKALNIKVTSKFKKMVFIGTASFAGVLLINLILSLCGVHTGLISVTGSVSWLAILCSAIGVGLAIFNLIIDFDFIEQGVRNQAPSNESWRAAFGLTVTMVWLYTELLRILSYFRR
ncbi:MAG: Bax inhibitor-1/YccA family protein [Propionibacteriaceae bacterium]|jgi:uncharacterized YccA/Bax inhibitor family protein|nr:Bax inhibitor-1/YccA family protein [Propionibacteriaceae bacterium]